MIILLAGIQVIPKDYGEAAEVFGATAWQRLRYVTLPLLRPSLQVALILRTLAAFQVFAIILALVGRTVPVLAEEAYNWSRHLDQQLHRRRVRGRDYRRLDRRDDRLSARPAGARRAAGAVT